MSNTAVAERPAVTGYDSLVRFYATRYLQGGRVVYSLDLSLAQIAGLLPAPDPASPQPGNRRIQPAHAAAFGQYIRSNKNWVAPAIVLRGTSEFSFEVLESIEGTEFGIISLPFLALTEIHILDGQHRILGMHLAIRGIATDLEKARAQLNRIERRKVPVGDDGTASAEADEKLSQIVEVKSRIEQLTAQRFRFEHERTSVQIFIEDEQLSYQQMFYDIADNALNITASVRARFDTRKAVNRVLQDVVQHSVLMDRVDLESDRLGRQNPHLLSAKHVADIIRINAVGIEGRIGRRVEADLDEAQLLERTNQFFTVLSETLTGYKALISGDTTAPELRNRTMAGSPVMIRVLAGVFQQLKKKGMSQTRIKRFFNDLDPYLEQPASAEWVKNTGGDLFFVGALSPSSRRQDLVNLTQQMVSWAEVRPDWMAK